MYASRILVTCLLFLSAWPAAAAGDDSDWALFGRIVAVVQPFLRLAIQSDDPRAVERGVDAALAGQNAEVNRLARELAAEVFEDMPPELRQSLGSLARDAVALARKERARIGERGDPVDADRTVQARKDLAAIGLRYYDAVQFLDAVRRDDALAVELYVRARGVNLAARDTEGRSAMEIARRAGNTAIVRLLETAG